MCFRAVFMPESCGPQPSPWKNSSKCDEPLTVLQPQGTIIVSNDMARETLQQQLEKLTRPQKDFDIEDEELKVDAFDRDGSGSESESENETAKRDHYVSVGESALRKSEAVRLGGKYKGSAISRDELYGEQQEVSDEEEEVSDEEEDEQEHAESDDDSGASLRANSDDEDDDDDDDEDDDEDDDDLAHKRNKLKQMMSNEKKHIVSRLSQDGSNNALKGYAILQQHKLFDSLIESRMKVQPAITNSNLLPANSLVLDHEGLSTKKTEKYIAKAKDACYDLLDRIFVLRQQMIETESISTTKVKHPKKRTLSKYLATSESYDSILNKYRQSVLIKWSAKIQNTSGSSAINSGKFKVINQSAEQQVQNNLMDMDRLVKRTKTNRRQIIPLGHEYYVEQANDGKPHKDEADNEDDEDDEENIDIPKDQGKDKNSMEQVDTIFDDEDFYRLLLNDLVDRKIQAQNPTSGLNITMRSARATKFKKNVDTKASKGRKLRYQVQEPIANFETSKGGWKWNDEQIDEFFASLLGQKVNMQEEDEEEMDGEEELITTGEEAIRLFG